MLHSKKSLVFSGFLKNHMVFRGYFGFLKNHVVFWKTKLVFHVYIGFIFKNPCWILLVYIGFLNNQISLFNVMNGLIIIGVTIVYKYIKYKLKFLKYLNSLYLKCNRKLGWFVPPNYKLLCKACHDCIVCTPLE